MRAASRTAFDVPEQPFDHLDAARRRLLGRRPQPFAVRSRADDGLDVGQVLGAAGQQLQDEVLLLAPVRVEILSGASRADRPRLRRLLSAPPVAYPGVDTWRRLDQWVDQAGDAGERFDLADLLVGALAVESGASVWSLDADFERLARIGLVDLYLPAHKSEPSP